jgi:membrane-associated phospholipid phosphatase
VSIRATRTTIADSRAGWLRMPPFPPFARELVLAGTAAAVYGGVRAATEGSVQRAAANGEEILHIERTLGIAWEAPVQSVALTSDTLVALANWIYIWGHWPVIIASAVVLYHHRRSSYVLLRNAFFLSGAVGFLFFALLPVAPPRLLDAGLVDTVLERSESYRTLQPPALTNEYAAFPSLHFGWNLLVGVVLFATFTHVAVRVFAVVMPAAMAIAVVASANHYLIDVLGGGLIAIAALLVLIALGAAREAAPTLTEPVGAPLPLPGWTPGLAPEPPRRGRQPPIPVERHASRRGANGSSAAPARRRASRPAKRHVPRPAGQ